MHVSRAVAVFAIVTAVGVACSDNSTGIPAGLEVYTATLNGANEAPTPVTTTATGHAIVTILGNVITWKVDIDTPIDSIIAGHIHRHAADSVSGNVRVDFAPTQPALVSQGLQRRDPTFRSLRPTPFWGLSGRVALM